jgi:hypothetical protein
MYQQYPAIRIPMPACDAVYVLGFTAKATIATIAARLKMLVENQNTLGIRGVVTDSAKKSSRQIQTTRKLTTKSIGMVITVTRYLLSSAMSNTTAALKTTRTTIRRHRWSVNCASLRTPLCAKNTTEVLYSKAQTPKGPGTTYRELTAD